MVLVYLSISCWTLQKLHTNTQSPWRCNLPNTCSIFLRPTALLSIKNYLLPNTNIRTFVIVTLSMSYSNLLSYGILIRAHYLLPALTNKKRHPILPSCIRAHQILPTSMYLFLITVMYMYCLRPSTLIHTHHHI